MREFFVVHRWSNSGPVAICESWTMQRAAEIAAMFRADFPEDCYYVVVEQR